MAQLSASRRRAAITYAVSLASAGALRTWIAAPVASLFAEQSSGRSVASVSMNGVSTSFSDPGSFGLSPAQELEMWQQLLELCDVATAYLGSSPSNSALATEMQGRLPDVYTHSVEFAGMQQW